MEVLPLIKHIENILKSSEKYSDKEGKLFVPKILDSIESIDKDLIKLLINDLTAKKHFFIDVEGTKVLKQNELIEFFTMNEYFNHSITSYPNKIGLIKKDNFIQKFDDVVLAFPYKDCVLEGGQNKEEISKDEIFYNNIISKDEIDRLFEPKVLTNIQKYTQEGIIRNPIIEDDNLIIKGNNLIALHSLKDKFIGQVKFIYIDPPYNTGSDSFGYNDRFNHSTWLTFMKNRLDASAPLLDQEEGVIAVQCSFHEYPYLKVLMDEIYTPKNYKCTFHIKVRHPDRVLTGDKEFNDVIEYILFYSKNSNYKFPKKEEVKTDDDYIYQIQITGEPEKIICDNKEVEIYSPDKYKQIKCTANSANLKTISVRGSLREKNSSGRFYVKHLEKLRDDYPPLTLFKVPNMGDDVFGYRYFHLPKEGNKNGTYFQGKPTSSTITVKPYANFYDFERDYNMVAEEGDVDFRNGKKPESLLKFLIELFTEENDIVLDYHLGSGTTCAVAHKMKRRYIGIEQMDYIQDISVKRINNIIQNIDNHELLDLNFTSGGSFIYAELKELDKFADSEINSLNKNMRYLPISEIDDEDYKVNKEEKKINKLFYGVKDE